MTRLKYGKFSCWVFVCALCATNFGCFNSKQADDGIPYLSKRSNFETTLLSPGPSPHAWEEDELPVNVQEISYQSGDLTLKAWLFVPPQTNGKKLPALVYLHGGFAFGKVDFLDCQPFIDAGFVVLAPKFRGENGMPGNFETFYGELDDAAAATRWLSEQSEVDPNRIYAFGHSSGGVLAAMLSLLDDVPVKHSGSSGGLYGEDIFDMIDKELVAFDPNSQDERNLRVLPGNVRWMKRPHYAFIGKDDDGVANGVATAREELRQWSEHLKIEVLPGDHFSSFPWAIQRYLDLIQESSSN